jgi:transposase InsO family protein
VPARQPKRGRLWDGDGSCLRLRPEYRNHVWSYDFVEARTHDGRKFRMLNVVDEFTRECLAIRVARKLKAADVIESWRHHYNTVRPHGSLGYRPPAPEVFIPTSTVWPAALAQLSVVKRPTVH